ncbi:MAG: WecB/TagA/CpsF family glycosyltransferase [Bacteroidales bacterium]
MEKEHLTLPLLNIHLHNMDMEELLKELHHGIVVTPNVDHFVKLQRDREFYEIYKKADYVLLDSRVIYYLLKICGRPIKAVIPGSDLLPAFCKFHKDNHDIKIFLLGAMDGIAQKAMENINQKVKRTMVVQAYSPSLGFEKKTEECKDIVNKINKSGANVLVIGVGAPKQEKWLIQYMPHLPHIKIALALGASIDFEAGHKKRSPLWMQKIGMEWFYRFLCEPRRLGKRYFIEDAPFIYLFMKQVVGKYKNPFADI